MKKAILVMGLYCMFAGAMQDEQKVPSDTDSSELSTSDFIERIQKQLDEIGEKNDEMRQLLNSDGLNDNVSEESSFDIDALYAEFEEALNEKNLKEAQKSQLIKLQEELIANQDQIIKQLSQKGTKALERYESLLKEKDVVLQDRDDKIAAQKEKLTQLYDEIRSSKSTLDMVSTFVLIFMLINLSQSLF